MAGKKGRSGRKSKSDEAKRLAIIEHAWDVVNDFLRSGDVTTDKKVVEAIKIVLKDMPSAPIVDQSQHTHITKVDLKISDGTDSPLTQETGSRLHESSEV